MCYVHLRYIHFHLGISVVTPSERCGVTPPPFTMALALTMDVLGDHIVICGCHIIPPIPPPTHTPPPIMTYLSKSSHLKKKLDYLIAPILSTDPSIHF